MGCQRETWSERSNPDSLKDHLRSRRLSKNPMIDSFRLKKRWTIIEAFFMNRQFLSFLRDSAHLNPSNQNSRFLVVSQNRSWIWSIQFKLAIFWIEKEKLGGSPPMDQCNTRLNLNFYLLSLPSKSQFGTFVYFLSYSDVTVFAFSNEFKPIQNAASHLHLPSAHCKSATAGNWTCSILCI